MTILFWCFSVSKSLLTFLYIRSYFPWVAVILPKRINTKILREIKLKSVKLGQILRIVFMVFIMKYLNYSFLLWNQHRETSAYSEVDYLKFKTLQFLFLIYLKMWFEEESVTQSSTDWEESLQMKLSS